MLFRSLELNSEEEMKEFAVRNLHFNGKNTTSLSSEEYLTVGKHEIIDLYRDGHLIFPHTHSHKRLAEIDNSKTGEEEIVQPKKILQDILHCKINAFALPVGTERVVSPEPFLLIKKEYQFCFSALAGVNTLETNPYFLHRDCLHPHFSLNHVQNILDGVYDLYYLYKMFLLKSAVSTHHKTIFNRFLFW